MTKKKRVKYMRTTISVPSETKHRMDNIRESVNWSAIAANAFAAKLDEIDYQQKSLDDIYDEQTRVPVPKWAAYAMHRFRDALNDYVGALPGIKCGSLSSLDRDQSAKCIVDFKNGERCTYEVFFSPPFLEYESRVEITFSMTDKDRDSFGEAGPKLPVSDIPSLYSMLTSSNESGTQLVLVPDHSSNAILVSGVKCIISTKSLDSQMLATRFEDLNVELASVLNYLRGDGDRSMWEFWR